MTSSSIPAGAHIGHVHLKVADLDRAIGFYRDLLGFDLLMNMGTAAFLSAGGYHHHLGLNTWAGVGAPPPPPGSAGLRYFVVRLPNAAALEQVLARVRMAALPAETTDAGTILRDPSGNGVVLAVMPPRG